MVPELGRYSLFIGGNWTESASGETFDVINPATEEVIATVANAVPVDMQAAIDAAAAVQPKWADTLAAERAQILQKAAAMMPGWNPWVAP